MLQKTCFPLDSPQEASGGQVALLVAGVCINKLLVCHTVDVRPMSTEWHTICLHNHARDGVDTPMFLRVVETFLSRSSW